MYLPYLSQYFLGKYTVSTVTVKGSGTQDCMRSVHARGRMCSNSHKRPSTLRSLIYCINIMGGEC